MTTADSKQKKSKSKTNIIRYKENNHEFVLEVAVQMFGPTKVLIVSDFKIPKQEDSSMLKLKNPVNLSRIFRDEKLVVQKRLKYLQQQTEAVQQELQQLMMKRTSLRTSESQGTIQIRQRLIIQVVEARNLVQTGVFSGTSDPYVEIALHSKQSFKQQKKPRHFAKTERMRNTRNPVWNKEFIFDGNQDEFYALGLDVKDKGLFRDSEPRNFGVKFILKALKCFVFGQILR